MNGAHFSQRLFERVKKMNDNNQNKGFTVNDRRIHLDDTSSTNADHGSFAANATNNTSQEGSSSTASNSRSSEEPASVDGPGWKMEVKDNQKSDSPSELPTMDFSHLCLSMASSVLICLGEVQNPESGKMDTNLPMARQTIDILAMLEEKTRGNLTVEESKLLTTVLYDLRMRFLRRKKQ